MNFKGRIKNAPDMSHGALLEDALAGDSSGGLHFHPSAPSPSSILQPHKANPRLSGVSVNGGPSCV